MLCRPVKGGSDGRHDPGTGRYSYSPEGADAEAQARLDRVAEEVLKQRHAWDLKPRNLPAARAILDEVADQGRVTNPD